MTAVKAGTELPEIRIGRETRVVAASLSRADAEAQIAGFYALEALALTQPLRAVDGEMLGRPKHASPGNAHHSGLRHLASRACEHRLRLVIFAANGLNVFAVGLLIQVILVQYADMGHITSYIVQTIASVQLNFLLSRYVTWRDRDVAFLQALAKFNLQQLAVTGVGMAGYAGLERLGVNYIAANVAATALLTPVSFLASHKWSMGEETHIRLRITAVPWPLLTILAAQAWLSLRLVHLDTPFADEALYLWVGHQDWAALFHGTPIPPFASYLSGSPVFYPPIGAIADSIGGITGARILSLGFMMIASSLLWMTCCRLYGKMAAFFAVALWAFLGETLRLGAFATYDPMACMLLATAGYCAVRAGQSEARGPHWAIATAAVLTVANCTKYATALFDPVVILLVMLVALTDVPSRKRAARMAAITASYLVIFLVGLVALATARNGYYTTGIEATTTGRASGGQSASAVLSTVWPYIKVIAPLTLLGALLCLWLERDLYRRLLTLLLALTGTLAPLNQIRIHTGTSLAKHEDFAAWFIAMAAGYAVSALIRGSVVQRTLVFGIGLVAAVATTLAIGLPYARFADSYWPNTARVVSLVRPMVTHTRGEILFQNPSILDYEIGPADEWSAIWKRISGQGSLRLPSGRTTDDAPVGSDGIPGPFIAALHHGYFQIVVLIKNGPRDSFDAQMVPAIEADPDYRLVAQVGEFAVWRYEPGKAR